MANNDIRLGIPDQDGQLSLMFTRGGPRRGAGRKGIGSTRKVSLTLSDEMWDAIEAHCQEHNRSKSEVLRTLIESGAQMMQNGAK